MDLIHPLPPFTEKCPSTGTLSSAIRTLKCVALSFSSTEGSGNEGMLLKVGKDLLHSFHKALFCLSNFYTSPGVQIYKIAIQIKHLLVVSYKEINF